MVFPQPTFSRANATLLTEKSDAILYREVSRIGQEKTNSHWRVTAYVTAGSDCHAVGVADVGTLDEAESLAIRVAMLFAAGALLVHVIETTRQDGPLLFPRLHPCWTPPEVTAYYKVLFAKGSEGERR